MVHSHNRVKCVPLWLTKSINLLFYAVSNISIFTSILYKRMLFTLMWKK